ncbi:hypothetical protein GCM10009785_19910 [Brooklawnia cerclae]|uniref:Uncharacterized protein n=1 Tax=Brooklawnia cerclae TaxID=349934 RepID=A0ABX0SFW5_9ACTN|nr:hypothetical protein [Brooklawnia cerclae]NIH57267.1 hypothetical protein [Brooklawnia cerclae]
MSTTPTTTTATSITLMISMRAPDGAPEGITDVIWSANATTTSSERWCTAFAGDRILHQWCLDEVPEWVPEPDTDTAIDVTSALCLDARR